MDLNVILSQLETVGEEDVEELLRQYIREVNRGSASTITNRGASVSWLAG